LIFSLFILINFLLLIFYKYAYTKVNRKSIYKLRISKTINAYFEWRYFFIFEIFHIHTVTATAIIVTARAYNQGQPEESLHNNQAHCASQGHTNNALIASFRASAATKPNAVVINTVNFSIICDFIVKMISL